MTKAQSVLAVLLLWSTHSFSQNQFNSRLFYTKPPLYNSKSKVNGLNLARFEVAVLLPTDNRSKYYGEVVYKKIKAREINEFLQSPAMSEIQSKMQADVKKFGAAHNRANNKIVIATSVEVFYPKVSGFIGAKSFAKVRLAIMATLRDSLLVNNKYESFYLTHETDKEFEGNLLMTEEEGTNVTLGMTLRKALDQFYKELFRAVTPGGKNIVFAGKVVNSKTGTGVSAKILFNADSSYSATSTSEGRYRLTVPAQSYSIQVQAADFVSLSDRIDKSASQPKVSWRNFPLQPLEKGAVVSLRSVLFYMGTATLLEESHDELDGVVAFLKDNPRVKIELDGYTDNRGDAKKDLELSQRRVERIKSYLESKGVSSHRIAGKGFGSTKPIASNDTEDGRKLNRRVEFVILKN